MTRSRRWRRACSITLRESARRGPCPCRTSGPKTPDSQAQYVGNVAGPDHGLHQAQCSKCFEWILYKSMWAQGNPNDATWMLGRLFCRIVPDCAKLFRARYTLLGPLSGKSRRRRRACSASSNSPHGKSRIRLPMCSAGFTSPRGNCRRLHNGIARQMLFEWQMQ